MSRALVVATLALLTISGAAFARSSQPAKQLTLRLPDLPGYAIERTGPDDTCSALNFVSDVPRDILQLERRVVADECTVLMEHMWTAADAPKGPEEVLSAAFATTDASGAAALLDRPRGTVASVAALPRGAWTVDPTAGAIGDRTVLLRAPGSAGFDDDEPSVAVLWRSGPVVALVAVTGLRGAAGEQTALRLAAVQQARIAAPTPLQPGDFDDSEVGLADPRLDVPVWWTGRDFQAPGLRRVRALQHQRRSGCAPLRRARHADVRPERELARVPDRALASKRARAARHAPRAAVGRARPLHSHRAVPSRRGHDEAVRATAPLQDRRARPSDRDRATARRRAHGRLLGLLRGHAGLLPPAALRLAAVRTILRSLRPREPGLLP